MSPLNTLHLHRIFDKLDRDKDGHVSIDELMWLLESTGVGAKRDELELLLGRKTLDLVDFLFFYETLIVKGKSGNNCFVQVQEKHDEILERDLRKAFRVFDLNDDGFICCEELKIALTRLGLWEEHCGQDCKRMIEVYDTNSDGLLDFEEFKAMMLVDD
ncbi:UNVERIFIED_CONTAM: putative calcium-binding protein CML44 [Sesamum radiatum]|uniref:Calcium-binding protein CML44 n=1 Tax=Sesamum radiatum TaxID=300843 RepID=A0AAW2M4R2_SESRA